MGLVSDAPLDALSTAGLIFIGNLVVFVMYLLVPIGLRHRYFGAVKRRYKIRITEAEMTTSRLSFAQQQQQHQQQQQRQSGIEQSVTASDDLISELNFPQQRLGPAFSEDPR